MARRKARGKKARKGRGRNKIVGGKIVEEKNSAAESGRKAVEPRKVMVAIHGIGDQFRYETIQSVTNQVCRYFGEPSAIPLGRFHSALSFEEQNTQAILSELRAAVAQTPIPPPPITQFPHAALLLTPPDGLGPELPVAFGFAEVYWADIPRIPVKDEHILEEAKKWARTVVERIRLRFKPEFELPNEQTSGTTGVKKRIPLHKENFEIAATVIEEMIETISVLDRLCFLAEKAGLFRFDLKKVLIDYLGDVQVVTEFTRYRERILSEFNRVLNKINVVMDGGAPPEIYIVAHSEGTVIAFMGLLEALKKPAAQRPAWVDNVKGFMTIGSPINKHIILWPELWDDLKNPDPSGARNIPWRNYYDFGDPVGFELKKTREWLAEFGWTNFFEFRQAVDDIGFARYPFPGKAHNDYWNDDEVFGHFIQTVVKPKRANGLIVPGPTKGVQPTNKWGWRIVSPLIPYLVMFVLCFVGVYFLYKGVAGFLNEKDPEDLTQALHRPPQIVLLDVLGLSGLMASVIACARIPRLTLLWGWQLLSWVLFVAAGCLYSLVVDPHTKKVLGSWLLLVSKAEKPAQAGGEIVYLILGRWFPTLGIHLAEGTTATVGILLIAALVAFLVPLVSWWWRSAYWGGTRLLVMLGGSAVLFLVVNAFIYHRKFLCDSGECLGPVWPLLLASAAFLYLWWLAALIFDLTFVWHRYIRNSVVEDRLRQLVPK